MLRDLLNAVDANRERILSAERALWKIPETGFREWKTCAWLKEEYRKLGYTLTEVGTIPGFTATVDTGRPGPTVLIMGEMDALICSDHPDADPDTGAVHACGHHAQSAALLGIAAALREPDVLDGLCGRVLLAAVPAEELIELGYRQSLLSQGAIHYFSGKIEMMYRGMFDRADMCILVHTGGRVDGLSLDKGGNGCVIKNIYFKGVARHASSPYGSVNALYAAQQAMSAINALRETFDDVDHIRVHPIITKGGDVVNAIPADVRMECYVRGESIKAIRAANERVNRAIAGSALALGASVRVEDIPGYCPLHNDSNMNRIAAEAIRDVMGDRVQISDSWSYGCTDMGDMSAVMPTVQMWAGGSAGIFHGNDFQLTDPENACVNSAKGQLSLLYRLLCNNAENAGQVLAEFRPVYETKADYFAAMESIRMNREFVEYTENGASVDWTNRAAENRA